MGAIFQDKYGLIRRQKKIVAGRARSEFDAAIRLPKVFFERERQLRKGCPDSLRGGR